MIEAANYQFIITTMPKTHCCSVMLTVVGDDLDPEIVSAALGMEADQSWRRGERKSLKRPDGTVKQFDSIYDDGGWKKFMPEIHKDKPLHDQLFLWIARLQGLREVIGSFRERGWTAELDCFAASSELLLLSKDDLQKIAGLGVDLALKISLPSNPQITTNN